MEYIPFPEYDALTAEDKARICNGCGPGGWKVNPIPNNLLGVVVTEPCNRHDMAYHLGQDKDEGDRDLLANMVTDIIQDFRASHGAGHVVDSALLKARLTLAVDYFIAVFVGGDAYFGKG